MGDPAAPSAADGGAAADALAATLDGVSAPSKIAQGTQPESAPLPHRIGRFVVLRKLGQGGMGVVYAAYDEELDRKVAVKLLHEAELASAERRSRILREAQAMARVSHPNVAHVYEVGEVNGQVFIAMELVDGCSLSAWQRQPQRTWDEILGMYLAAGQGLLAAHQVGLIHRDFKPDNVLVENVAGAVSQRSARQPQRPVQLLRGAV